MLVIVPVEVEDAINEKLDIAIKKHPQAEKDRESFYTQLLEIWDARGIIPDIDLTPKDGVKP